jgi:hypothetical protein
MEAAASIARTSKLRSLLERTGQLQTKDLDDPGHLSQRWRKEITALLDSIDSGAPLGSPATPSTPQEEIDALIGAVRRVISGDLEAKVARAVWLIEEALPRMKTLDNAISARWVPIAEAFLADGSTIRF